MGNDNEQWLLDGGCNKCRREKYCSKPCRANERRVYAGIESMILSKTHLGAATRLIKDAIDMAEERRQQT